MSDFFCHCICQKESFYLFAHLKPTWAQASEDFLKLLIDTSEHPWKSLTAFNQPSLLPYRKRLLFTWKALNGWKGKFSRFFLKESSEQSAQPIGRADRQMAARLSCNSSVSARHLSAAHLKRWAFHFTPKLNR